MQTQNALLEIQFSLEDGRTIKFAQNDPVETAKIIAHIQPSRLLAQQQILIHGKDELTIFPCATIVRIDLVGEGLPGLFYHPSVSAVREITQEELTEGRHWKELGALSDGAERVGYAELELVTGQMVFVETRFTQEPTLSIDRDILFQGVLAGNELHFQRRVGGIAIINTRKIARLALYPSPPPPAVAWRAECISR